MKKIKNKLKVIRMILRHLPIGHRDVPKLLIAYYQLKEEYKFQQLMK